MKTLRLSILAVLTVVCCLVASIAVAGAEEPPTSNKVAVIKFEIKKSGETVESGVVKSVFGKRSQLSSMTGTSYTSEITLSTDPDGHTVKKEKKSFAGDGYSIALSPSEPPASLDVANQLRIEAAVEVTRVLRWVNLSSGDLGGDMLLPETATHKIESVHYLGVGESVDCAGLTASADKSQFSYTLTLMDIMDIQ